MTTYTHIMENWEVIDLPGLDDQQILQPKYQCELCGKAVSERWARITGRCGYCQKGINQIGRYIGRIYSVGIYVSDANNHDLSNELAPPKDGTYAEKKARILQWGVENLNYLDEADVLVPPPSGSDPEDNHMIEPGERLSALVDTRFIDVVTGDIDRQTDMETPEERRDNVEGAFECEEDMSDTDTVLVIDDIVTTCGTMSDTARTLKESGASRVLGLGATRAIKLENLDEAGYLEEEAE